MISLFGENSLPSLDCTAFFVYLCHLVVVFTLHPFYLSVSELLPHRCFASPHLKGEA